MRTAHGLSLRQLAQAAGISAAALSRWEADQAIPRVPELEAVLNALEASETQTRSILLHMHAPRAVHKLRSLDGPGAFTPFGGDMLWAMRQRKGWTQTETARAASVTQAQIARWESGDAWPSPPLLHTLCWHLEARPGELEALTRHEEIATLGGAGGTDWNAARSWDGTRWSAHLFDLMHFPPAGSRTDLHLLITEQRLIHLAQTDTRRHALFTALLADMYAVHARHCVERGQEAGATRWAERGLALKRGQHPAASGLPSDATLWFGNVVALATSAQESNRPATVRNAARLIQEWLPALPIKDTQHSWGKMLLALTLAKLRQFDAALHLARKACDDAAAATFSPCDVALRLRDLANIALDAGRPADAVAALSQSTAWWPLSQMPPDHLARHYLLSARGFVALGDKRAASDHLEAAERLVMRQGILPLQAELQSVLVTADTLR